MSDNKDKKAFHAPIVTGVGDELKIEAAMFRLRNSSDEENALEAVREIVANLLGSEQMGLYQVDEKKGFLWLYWSFGIDAKAYRLLDPEVEPVLNRVINGETYFKNSGGDIDGHETEQNTTAYVPLRFRGRVVAVLAILSWLPQKNSFDRTDVEILELLSNEAANALFNSRQPFPTCLLKEQAGTAQ